MKNFFLIILIFSFFSCVDIKPDIRVQQIIDLKIENGVNKIIFISKKTQNELVNVFLPTTPNPTSGFLLMVPKKELVYLDVSFEQASKFIVSAGTSNID